MEEQEMDLGPQNKIETLEYDVKLLGEKLEEAQRDINRMRRALEFYAKSSNYQPIWDDEADDFYSEMDRDQGRMARAAL